mmetsp:Transcript_2332/g.3678  ORF Transcript_2332/g.3678 Transcript_2332/m.3678 type:complete len:134 (+) Transcript_2332:30-431(+)
MKHLVVEVRTVNWNPWPPEVPTLLWLDHLQKSFPTQMETIFFSPCGVQDVPSPTQRYDLCLEPDVQFWPRYLLGDIVPPPSPGCRLKSINLLYQASTCAGMFSNLIQKSQPGPALNRSGRAEPSEDAETFTPA